MQPKKYLLFLLLITLLAVFLRFNSFLTSPPGFHIDEADIGYQAYSILLTQRDYYGNLLPIHPQSFTDRRPFLYMYIIVPFVATFGLNEFGIRIPSVLFGILSVPVIFFLGKNIFYKKAEQEKNLYGLTAAFILAILPWHIHYSRVGYELTFMLFLLILGLTFFYKWLYSKKDVFLSLSIFLLLATIYAYSTAKLFIPLLILCLILLYRSQISLIKKWEFIKNAVFVILLLLPLLKDTLSGIGGERFAILSVFTDLNALSNYFHYRFLSTFAQPIFPLNFIHPHTLSQIFFNFPTQLFYRISHSYLSVFSPEFLIFSGDPNPRHIIPASGFAGLTVTLLFVAGLISLVTKNESEYKKLFLSLLIISPIASSITREGAYHGTRFFFVILPLVLISSFAAYKLFFRPKSATKSLLILLFILFLGWEITRDHFIRLAVYPFSAYSSYNWGFKQITEKVNSYKDSVDEVIIDNSEGAPIQTLYAFYQKENPSILQRNIKNPLTTSKVLTVDSKSYTEDNVSLASINPEIFKEKFLGKALVIIHKNIIDKNRIDIKKITDWEVVDNINSPLGETLYYFLRNKSFEIK